GRRRSIARVIREDLPAHGPPECLTQDGVHMLHGSGRQCFPHGPAAASASEASIGLLDVRWPERSQPESSDGRNQVMFDHLLVALVSRWRHVYLGVVPQPAAQVVSDCHAPRIELSARVALMEEPC